MDVKVGFPSKNEKNSRGILYRPNPQKESGTALHVSTSSVLFGNLAIVQSRLHLPLARQFLLEKRLPVAFLVSPMLGQ